MDLEEQIISFAIHNPHARDIQCSVLLLDGPKSPYRRCPEVACWAVVEQQKDRSTLYTMTAFCEQHFRMTYGDTA